MFRVGKIKVPSCLPMEDKLFLLGEMKIFGDTGEDRLVERGEGRRESLLD